MAKSVDGDYLIKVNDENVFEIVNKQAFDDPSPKPLFLFFMNRECDECWKHSKDWVQLSKVTKS